MATASVTRVRDAAQPGAEHEPDTGTQVGAGADRSLELVEPLPQPERAGRWPIGDLARHAATHENARRDRWILSHLDVISVLKVPRRPSGQEEQYGRGEAGQRSYPRIRQRRRAEPSTIHPRIVDGPWTRTVDQRRWDNETTPATATGVVAMLEGAAGSAGHPGGLDHHRVRLLVVDALLGRALRGRHEQRDQVDERDQLDQQAQASARGSGTAPRAKGPNRTTQRMAAWL